MYGDLKDFFCLCQAYEMHISPVLTDVLSSHVLLKYNFLIHCSILWKWNSKSKHSFPETWVQILIRSQMKWNSSRSCISCTICPMSVHFNSSGYAYTHPKVRPCVHKEETYKLNVCWKICLKLQKHLQNRVQLQISD